MGVGPARAGPRCYVSVVRLLCVALVTASGLAVTLPASSSRAQTSDLAVDDGGGWAEVFDAERRMGLLYRRHGLARLLQAMGTQRPYLGDGPRWMLLEQALVRFERARRRIGEDPELAYYTAYALTRWQRPGRDGGLELRVDEAIDAWHRLRELAPDYMPDRVAYELALLHMRRHEFARARAEYEAALRHAIPPTVQIANRFYLANQSEISLAELFIPLDPAQLHGNMAEVTMLAGDLPAAAHHYRVALDRAIGPYTRTLAHFGLSLALSRMDDHEGALETAGQAIREDPAGADPDAQRLHRAHGPLAVLHLESVFFEPPWELHAYEAIGHEAWAREPGVDRTEHLRSALRSWRLFLTEGGITSRYAAHARAHAARLEGLLHDDER